ncbi:hypothetical protein ACP8Y2_16725 [Herpetosiphon llansteffanensis]
MLNLLRRVCWVTIVSLLLVASLNPQPSSANAFEQAAFKTIWQRTDGLVQQGLVGRTWLWGPEAAMNHYEAYAENPNGARLVQYFDKSRMEISNPNAPHDQWFVTNGLIVKEMVSSKLQIGDDAFLDYQPAIIPVAGDLNSTNTPPSYRPPTYAGFGLCEPQLVTGKPATKQLGQPVTALWQQDCGGGTDSSKATQYPETAIAAYDDVTGTNIPAVFWDYLHQAGPIVDQTGAQVNAKPLFDWLYVLGHPITESYWARIMVAGIERDVLVQLYERRVLTYTPANPLGWQVEMGNVGNHYYQWRYMMLPSTTPVDCNGLETIYPESNQATSIKNQALMAISQKLEQKFSSFEQVWSIERSGVWISLQAQVEGFEPAIIILNQATASSMQVQAVWSGQASEAKIIRNYLLEEAPKAPPALINCLAPYGFVNPTLGD